MEPNDINSIQPELNPKLNISKLKKVVPLNLLIGIIVGVILTASVASAVYFYQKATKLETDNFSETSGYLSPTDTPVSPIPTSESSPYQITWLEKPQKIAALDIFDESKLAKNDYGFIFKDVRYYLIANLGDESQLINLFLPTESPENYENIFRFIKSKDGQISIINTEDTSLIKPYLLSKVSSVNIYFKELNPPDFIRLDNVSFKNGYRAVTTFDGLIDPILVKSTEYGDLYVVYSNRKDFDGIYGKTYYLKLKDWTIYIFQQQYGFLSDNRKVLINWNDSSSTSDDEFTDNIASDSCSGYGNTSVIKNGSYFLNNKVAVATNSNSTFYQIKDITNPFLKKLYELYKNINQYITPAALPDIDTYSNVKNHFLYQDFSGDWVIFTNTKYTISAECGKPVIYLYPEKETEIKVQVAAKITKSEPLYPQGGWTVLAKPNGELTYQNQNYPYLFWEGLGHGLYPDYRNRGTLTTQKDLVETVYKQLSELGLNQKESSDFMEFWQPKLPKAPYVRLTWLDTQDMDTLAPLGVYPKPDTKIRVFLEFEGFEKPVSLIPQKLSAPKRQGFTLVEWGGLLLK